MRSRDKVFPFFSGRLASASRSGVKEVRNGVRHYLLHYLSCPNTSPPNPRTQEQHSNQSQSPLLQALESQSQPSTSARPSGWQLPEKQSSIYDLKWNTLSSPVLTGPRPQGRKMQSWAPFQGYHQQKSSSWCITPVSEMGKSELLNPIPRCIIWRGNQDHGANHLGG